MIAAVSMLCGLTIAAAGPEPAAAGEGSLELVHEIPRSSVPKYGVNELRRRPVPLAVDPVNDLGLAWGLEPEAHSLGQTYALFLYDLETLELVDAKATTDTFLGGVPNNPDLILGWAFDPEGRRAIASGTTVSGGGNLCGESAGIFGGDLEPETRAVVTVEYDRDEAGRWSLPGLPDAPDELATNRLVLPCPNDVPTGMLSASIWTDPISGARKLYTLETNTVDNQVRGIADTFGLGLTHNAGQSLLVRQIDLDEVDAGNPLDALDWEIDLVRAGCSRLEVPFIGRTGDAVVSYCTDTDLVRGIRNPMGTQGYVVRIDLDDHDQPEPLLDSDDGAPNTAVRRFPTFSGRAQPFLDAESGRLMLLTNDAVNGNAVWVFDVFGERFVGVMTHGQLDATSENDDTGTKNAAGFDLRRGRAYLFSPNGILVGPARQDPPLAALRFEVLDSEDNLMSVPVIATVPSQRYVIFPMQDRGYVVLRDDVPDPDPLDVDDPDRLTTQVEEQEGLTVVISSGEAEGSGLRLVSPGGATRAARQADGTCTGIQPARGDGPEQSVWNQLETHFGPLIKLLKDGVQPTILDGTCVWDRLFSSGNREVLFGWSEALPDSSIDISAAGHPVAFRDEASDHDVKSAGECHRTTISESAADGGGFFIGQFDQDGDDSDEDEEGDDEEDNDEEQSPQEQHEEDIDQVFGGLYHQFCEGSHQIRESFEEGGGDQLYDEGVAPLPDMRKGAAGRDRRGFPAPGASCLLATGANNDRQGLIARDETGGGVLGSRVICDFDRLLGAAEASGAGVVLPDASDPVLVVGSAASWSHSEHHPEDGMVTTAVAVTNHVVIGPLAIDQIRSEATTRAKGRTGTAASELQRVWCGVTLGGESVTVPTDEDESTSLCIDPESRQAQELLDAVNQGLQRVQLRVPAANGGDGQGEPTPGGAQAVLQKEPSVRAADNAVNDDPGFTVPALQAVVLNDGAEGRNRFVVQFAGVRAESRYAIQPIPQFVFAPFEAAPLQPQVLSTVEPRPGIPSTPAVPGRVQVIEEVVSSGGGGSQSGDGGPFARFFQAPVDVVRAGLHWLWNNPGEAALLFIVWSVLTTPVYLGIRRRTFEIALAAQEVER